MTHSPQDRLAPRIQSSLQLGMNGRCAVVNPGLLRLLARAQPARDELNRPGF
jgi:hypothetical protein